jgi:hypothetical protein
MTPAARTWRGWGIGAMTRTRRSSWMALVESIFLSRPTSIDQVSNIFLFLEVSLTRIQESTSLATLSSTKRKPRGSREWPSEPDMKCTAFRTMLCGTSTQKKRVVTIRSSASKRQRYISPTLLLFALERPFFSGRLSRDQNAAQSGTQSSVRKPTIHTYHIIDVWSVRQTGVGGWDGTFSFSSYLQHITSGIRHPRTNTLSSLRGNLFSLVNLILSISKSPSIPSSTQRAMTDER